MSAALLFPSGTGCFSGSIPAGLLVYVGALLALGVISRNEVGRLYRLLTTGSKSL